MNTTTATNKIRFEIGCYGGSQVSIYQEEKQLVYVINRCSGMPWKDIKTILHPDKTEYEAFWCSVRTIDVWHWRKKYQRPGMLDGIFWHLQLANNDNAMQSEGHEAYPPDGRYEPSEMFKQFLQALGTLVHDEKLINEWYSD